MNKIITILLLNVFLITNSYSPQLEAASKNTFTYQGKKYYKKFTPSKKGKTHHHSNHKHKKFKQSARKTHQIGKHRFNPNLANPPMQLSHSNGRDVLDSHHLTHQQARRQVDRYLAKKRNRRSFIVITGKGLHSKLPPFAMKNNIKSHMNLQHRNWKVVNDKFNSGKVLVYPRNK